MQLQAGCSFLGLFLARNKFPWLISFAEDDRRNVVCSMCGSACRDLHGAQSSQAGKQVDASTNPLVGWLVLVFVAGQCYLVAVGK